MDFYKKERNEEIVNRYRNGEKVKDIAEDYGITENRIWAILKVKGNFSESQKLRELSKVKNQALKKFMYDKDITISDLSIRTGVSYSSILNFAQGGNVMFSTVHRISKATNIPIQNLVASYEEVGNA